MPKEKKSPVEIRGKVVLLNDFAKKIAIERFGAKEAQKEEIPHELIKSPPKLQITPPQKKLEIQPEVIKAVQIMPEVVEPAIVVKKAAKKPARKPVKKITK